ncbi:fam-m protein [Plasmodium brasilianum]|nr:fam-m protein [Plasmodium brasilianum]
MLIKSTERKYKYGIILDKRNYRIIAKTKQDIYPNVLCLKEKFPNNENIKYKNISNNAKGVNRRNKQSNRSLLNEAQYYTEVIDYNNGMFDGKHFHFEKKWIKKKDYIDFLEKKRRICNIALKKIKFKNYGYIVAMFVIFFFFGIGLPVLSNLESLDTAWNGLDKKNVLKILYEAVKGWDQTAKSTIYLTIFSVLMLTLIIVLVKGICKILRNNEKYNKIKLITE